MGESNTDRTARLVVAVTAGLAVTALLSSCAALTGAPGATAPTSASASAASAPAATSPAPAPSETAPAESPAPTAAATSAAPEPDATAAAAVKAQVVPFLTSVVWDGKAGTLDVGALVPKVVQSGGTCTLTAVRGDVQRTVSGKAVAAASYTGCPQLVLHRDDLAAGDWRVTVSYSSDESAGTSAARTVTVK